MNIVKYKAFDDTKIYLQSIFFDKCITNEIKDKIDLLYSELTVDNSYEIQRQTQEILVNFRKLTQENRLLENRVEDQPVFQYFIGFLMLLGLISYMISRNILNSPRNHQQPDIIIKIVLGLSIGTLVLFMIYCISFNLIYHNTLIY